jgi:organic hydroperoxide reductase OsmC/OhrA
MHYTAETIWRRGEASEEDFVGRRYSRKHRLRFDGGIEVPGSASPHVVPLPYSDAAAVDPEEAFVSALSSCHMLWFLDLASRAGFCVDRYADSASGVMKKNEAGQLAMTSVVLHPAVEFSGARMPSREEVERLHHEAHEACFIANSVKTAVRVEPVFA